MPLLCSQTEGSRGDDDDARSTTSSSSRKSSGGRQQAARAATVRQSRAGKPGSRVATMGDYIEQALEEQRRKAERKVVAAAARTSRSERRASGEGLLPPVNEQQPSLQREASMASEAASGSPMSVTMEPPVSDGSTRLPAAQAASVDRMASDYDSSDEEGAHKPPSPPPEPPPAQQPLPPPPMQLAAQAHCLAAKLPAVTTPVTGEQQSRTRPRTTRVSDAKSRGRRQSFIEFAEREKERREKQADRRQRQKDLRELEIALAATLSSPGVSIYDLLMAEYALQPHHITDGRAGGWEWRAAHRGRLDDHCHELGGAQGLGLEDAEGGGGHRTASGGAAGLSCRAHLHAGRRGRDRKRLLAAQWLPPFGGCGVAHDSLARLAAA